MPQSYPFGHSPFRLGSRLALGCALASASGSLAGDEVQWRLEASVPVICAILQVRTRPDRPAGLAIETNCNAERYQLIVHGAAREAGLRAAQSSAGSAQIAGSTVTIASTRPGYALTTIELIRPVSPAGPVAVTLQPL